MRKIPYRHPEFRETPYRRLHLCGQDGVGLPVGEYRQLLFSEPAAPFRKEFVNLDDRGIFSGETGVVRGVGNREVGNEVDKTPHPALGFEYGEV